MLGIDCDDGIACTHDTCVKGGCVHIPDSSVCDDGVFCNGAETCDAILDCQPAANPCTDPALPACDETADVCVECLSDPECNDGVFCDGDELCVGNARQEGTPPSCDDGVDCTVDVCDALTKTCTNTPDDVLCDDGLFCSGVETCDPTLDCQVGIPPCEDSADCTIDACDEILQDCAKDPDDVLCDDRLFCNGVDTCDATLGCQAGTPSCDDDLFCTIDMCDQTFGGCTHEPLLYGDVDNDGDVDLLDLFCILSGFSGDFSIRPFEDVDIQQCEGDGDIDLFSVLNAFSGIDPCFDGLP